jgi:hypothetical protein
MRTLLFAAALAAAFAAEPDARILRLITPETYKVIGIDFEQFERSNLAARFPLSAAHLLPDLPQDTFRVRGIVQIARRDQPELTVLTGEFPPQRQIQHEGRSAISPEPGFLLIGEVETLNVALTAWRDTNKRPPAWTTRIQELSTVYDNWMIILEPISDERRGIAPAPAPHWEALRKSVQVASFGIRLGGTHQLFAAVQMATDDDAIAEAALARWLPGLLERDQEFTGFVDATENIQIRRNGTTVELTFNLNGDKLPKPATVAPQQSPFQ